MRLRFGFFLVLLFLFSTTTIDAENAMLGKSYFLIGIDESYYNYEEQLDGLTANSTSGTAKSQEYGITSLLNIEGRIYPRETPFYGGFQFEYGGGVQTYNGSLQDSAGVDSEIFIPYMTRKSNTFTKLKIFAGPYLKGDDYLLDLHAGALFYYWYRGLGVQPENYYWLYLPVGAGMTFDIGNDVTIGLSLDYRIMVMGIMQIGTSAEIPSATPVTLGARNGFYFEAPIHIKALPYMGLEIKPWFEWRPSGLSNYGSMTINDGSPDGSQESFVEPESNSNSVGLSISALFGKFTARSGPVSGGASW